MKINNLLTLALWADVILKYPLRSPPFSLEQQTSKSVLECSSIFVAIYSSRFWFSIVINPNSIAVNYRKLIDIYFNLRKLFLTLLLNKKSINVVSLKSLSLNLITTEISLLSSISNIFFFISKSWFLIDYLLLKFLPHWSTLILCRILFSSSFEHWNRFRGC